MRLEPTARVCCLLCGHQDPRDGAALDDVGAFSCERCGVVNDTALVRAPALGTAPPAVVPLLQVQDVFVSIIAPRSPLSDDPFRRDAGGEASDAVRVTWQRPRFLGAMGILVIAATGIAASILLYFVVGWWSMLCLVACALAIFALGARALNRWTLTVDNGVATLRSGPFRAPSGTTPHARLHGDRSPDLPNGRGHDHWPPDGGDGLVARTFSSVVANEPAIALRADMGNEGGYSFRYVVVFVDQHRAVHELSVGRLDLARVVYAALAGYRAALPVTDASERPMVLGEIREHVADER